MASNPLTALSALGQSIWLDTIGRGLLTSGEFQRLIDEDGLRGVTSNPSIFEKAIVGSEDYDSAIRALAASGQDSAGIYEALVLEDIRRAADLLRPVYDRLEGADGFVSLEVSPRLARDTAASIAEARRLWQAVDRPNLMIKIPATAAGVPAIRQLLSEGINVNVTLLFGLARYREVVEACLGGLEARARAGAPIRGIASVASFFLSRIDTLLDPELEKQTRSGGARAVLARGLHGQVATACARAAYGIYEELFGGERYRALAAAGARTQRLLWASTSTKNPAYSDVKYVEALVYPTTINTLPLETIAAYRDHGRPQPPPERAIPEARELLERLPELGIDLEAAARRLEEGGVAKFVAALDQLLGVLERKRSAVLGRAPRGVAGGGARTANVAPRGFDTDRFCRTLAREAADAIVYADAAGRIRFWNQGAARIFGFAEGEALGQPLDIIIPERLRARHAAGYAQTMRTGKTRYGSGDVLAVPALRKDGSQISVEFTVLPFRDERGGMLGIAAILRDVTTRFEETKALRRELAAARGSAG